MQNGTEFYDPHPDLKQFYQGDILRDVPFPAWPTEKADSEMEKWPILRATKPERAVYTPGAQLNLPAYMTARAKGDLTDLFANGSEFVVGVCRIARVMVVTRACQLDNRERKHVLVAPVMVIDELPAAARSELKIKGWRENAIPHNFYLPEDREFPESFADFMRITPIHRSLLRDPLLKEHLDRRLTTESTGVLQRALTVHFGEEFGFDRGNAVPQPGRYRCMTCFARGKDVPITEWHVAGVPFGNCAGCGEAAAFVKMPGYSIRT